MRTVSIGGTQMSSLLAKLATVASKFFEHFILISDAMTFRAGGKETSLWNDEDG